MWIVDYRCGLQVWATGGGYWCGLQVWATGAGYRCGLQVGAIGGGFPGKDSVSADVTIEEEVLGKFESSGRWPLKAAVICKVFYGNLEIIR